MNQDFTSDADRTVINAPATDATQIVSAPQANVTQMAATVECPVCRTMNSTTETYCTDCGFLLGSTPEAVEVPEEQEPAARLVAPDGREFLIDVGPNTVGRVDADILLPDPTVSRKHAEIACREDAWWLTDLGSTNGTFIDDVQLQPNQPMQMVNNSTIKFGTSVLTMNIIETVESAPAPAETTVVVDQAPEEAEAAAEEAEVEEEEVEVVAADTAAEYTVEPVEAETEPVQPEVVEPETPAIAGKLVNLTDPSANYPIISGTNTIGRVPDNSIHIVGDPYVSSHHARIDFDGEKFTLTDIGSTNGTLLNGNPIPRQEPQDLNPGDEIGIGQGRYRLEA